MFAADSVDAWSDDALVEEFRRVPTGRLPGAGPGDRATSSRGSTPPGGHAGTRKPAVGRLVEGFRERLSALEQIDFFGSAGRDRVATLLGAARGHGRGATPKGVAADRARVAGDLTAYTGRLWVTRPRPGVDRMSSAWLIRRFIDPAARFGFAADRDALPDRRRAVRHVRRRVQPPGRRLHLRDAVRASSASPTPAVARIAAIVHDLDLKDGRFGAAEAGTVAAVIDGLQLATADDDTLLERGITLFESLYLAFAQEARPIGPRQVAKPRRQAPPKARASTSTRRRSR